MEKNNNKFTKTFNNSNKVDYNNYIEYTNVNYGNHWRNTFDICLPKNKTGKIGLMLFIHGGGWISGDKSDYYFEMKHWCDTQGYVSATLNHRFANASDITLNNILDDITACLNTIKALAISHKIEIQKAMLCGFSAGAHLALMYAYKNFQVAPIMPCAVASFSGPTDFTDPAYNNIEFAEDIKYMISQVTGVDMHNQLDHKTLLQNSPISYVTKNSVPTIICHGAYDNVVPYNNAISLKNKLEECNITHNLLTFPNSSHGLENDNDYWRKSTNIMIKYAKKYLNDN